MAAVILLLAPVIARFVRGAIEVGVGEMGFTNAALLGLFIGVVGGMALAFGLGGREVAAEITRDWYSSTQSAPRKIQGDSADAASASRRPSVQESSS